MLNATKIKNKISKVDSGLARAQAEVEQQVRSQYYQLGSRMFEARRQEELKQLREEQRLHEVAKAGLGEAVEGKQSLVVGLPVVVVIVLVCFIRSSCV